MLQNNTVVVGHYRIAGFVLRQGARSADLRRSAGIVGAICLPPSIVGGAAGRIRRAIVSK